MFKLSWRAEIRKGNFILKKRAFTLIELLVVIAIIAMLLAILMPGLKMAKKKAQKLVCLSNHKQIGIGLTSYAVSNEQRFPAFYGEGGNGSPYFYATKKNNLADDILTYVGDTPKVFVCPMSLAEPPDRTLRSGGNGRWNFTYMGNYKSAKLNYESPVKRSTASGTNGMWSEHTADVGSSHGYIRASHVKRSDLGKFPNTPGRKQEYGLSYSQWSVTDEKNITGVSCLFVDGSSRELKLEEMYYKKTSYGGNWYPPARGYMPNNSDPR